uniref:SLC2A4 regulator n=1 Tax=Coturnix japonica TaxID=93934 RepID=A0A8C2T0Y4_COTJA
MAAKGAVVAAAGPVRGGAGRGAARQVAASFDQSGATLEAAAFHPATREPIGKSGGARRGRGHRRHRAARRRAPPPPRAGPGPAAAAAPHGARTDTRRLRAAAAAARRTTPPRPTPPPARERRGPAGTGGRRRMTARKLSPAVGGTEGWWCGVLAVLITAPCAHPGRRLPGKAGIDEVMAAAVLTSLSSSPLGLGHPPAPPGPELGSGIWKETPAMSFSCSSSSNTSGEWSWDPPSDHSTPSTPSPPLSSHDPSAFLPTLAPDNGPEEPDSTHFMFGEPTPRKRKNSTKVMFKCLWKSCGKVLSSSSGMQKHIRTAHLGRQADLEQSDGEEDFYYTELDVDVDSLTDGLSSLTPVSPTSSVPPAFPGPELPPFPSPEPPLGSPRSPPPPPGLCHVHTDHAYQHTDIALPCRKPRGEAKKCRKVYGMENRELWCTACRWKKACQRFLD